MVKAADALLAEGRTEPAVIELSILESPILAEAAPIFERVCAQIGVIIPSKVDAVYELLRIYLKPIASGTQQPYEGLQAIMREVYFPHIDGQPCKKYVGDSHGLEQLIAAFWSYDDLMERPREVSWDGKHGAEAIARWGEFVRQHSRDWLQTHDG